MRGPAPHRTLAVLLGTWLVAWGLLALAQAAPHALLIGVDYQDCQATPQQPGVCPRTLYGPRHDVAALKRLLVERYQFPAAQVTTLLNAEATRDAILAALRRLQQTTAPQDVVLVYFSGHGTSGADPDLRLAIAPSSGALVPADARVYAEDMARTLDGLVLGTRDLRPLFSALEQERRLVVIFDACFSGNTVRSTRPGPGLPRYLPLPRPRALTVPEVAPAPPRRPPLPFPYTNLIYLAAADETELAKDLDTGTLDGQPHGALTNALLLGLGGAADTNHNGTITYRELHEYVRREVSPRYGHTPQLLAQTDLERPVFEVVPTTLTPAPSLALTQGPVRVKLEATVPTPLRTAVTVLPGVTVTTAAYDVLVTPEGAGYTLSLANGDTLCRLDSPEEVTTRLARYASVRALLALRPAQPRFNVRLQLSGSASQTVFVAGEHLDITLESERAATLLLLNIDPQGEVQTLTSAVGPGGRLTLPGAGVVEAPFGTEYLKVFALPQPPPGLERWSNRRLEALGNEVPELLRVLQHATGWAETLREVVTVPRP